MAQRHGVVSFSRCMWKEHKLVSFRSLDPGDVNLLDVVVNVGSHGFPGLGRGPVLVRIGTLFDLGAAPAVNDIFFDAESSGSHMWEDPDPDLEDYEDEVDVSTLLGNLQEERKKFESSRRARAMPRLRHFTRTHLGDWMMNLQSSDELVSHVCGLAGASILGDQARACRLEGIQAEAVNVDHVAMLFSADPRKAGWLPDTALIQLRRAGHNKSSSRYVEVPLRNPLLKSLPIRCTTAAVTASSCQFGNLETQQSSGQNFAIRSVDV